MKHSSHQKGSLILSQNPFEMAEVSGMPKRAIEKATDWPRRRTAESKTPPGLYRLAGAPAARPRPLEIVSAEPSRDIHRLQLGQREAGIERMRVGLEALHATDAVTMMGYFSGLLAESYGDAAQADEGLNVLSGVDGTREQYWEAELYRLKGELILRRAGANRLANDSQAEAQACFRQALTIARTQNAKSLELRAAMSLCRLQLQ
jgi:hypothetical protein